MKYFLLCRPYSSSQYQNNTTAMRYVQFERNGFRGVGVELKEGGDIVDVSGYDPFVPSNMRDFIAGGTLNVIKAKRAVDNSKAGIPRNELTVLAPITNPDKLICVGMNYTDHCQELNIPVPKEPVVFRKFNNSITGPNGEIPYPSETEQLDWEVELAVVVGKEGRRIAKAEAIDYVFGFTVALDVTARDWQKRNGGQVLLAKGMDGFCPIGPALVAKEDVADPHNLHLWTKVNGVPKQDSNTKHLVFKIDHLVSHLSRFFTLKPGDIILTGTPPGVGVSRKPPEFLKVGDRVEIGIEGIGSFTNKVFDRNGVRGVGVELKEGGDIVDVSGYDPSVPSNMRDFIIGGRLNVIKAKRAVNSNKAGIPRSELTILAPITNPDKLICLGMNYANHCQELNVPVPTEPVVFRKFNNSIIGPNGEIPYPSETEQLDWEVELAVVIGKEGKRIEKTEAMDYVFGYTVALDVNARDWQNKNGGQVLLATGMDGFCPIGPALLAKEDVAVADPHNLHLWTKVNGVTKQDSNTKHLVFKIDHLIYHLSRFFTLKPGDIILTGTPPGIGLLCTPPEFLKVGDRVEVGIEGIGILTNKVI